MNENKHGTCCFCKKDFNGLGNSTWPIYYKEDGETHRCCDAKDVPNRHFRRAIALATFYLYFQSVSILSEFRYMPFLQKKVFLPDTYDILLLLFP